MWLSRRDKHERASFYRPMFGAIEEHALASDHDINLISFMRFLRIPILGRVKFSFEGTV